MESKAHSNNLRQRSRDFCNKTEWLPQNERKPRTTETSRARARDKYQKEREELLNAIEKLQCENRTLQGQLQNLSPEKLVELKAQNKELKEQLDKAQKALAEEIVTRKNPWTPQPFPISFKC